MSLIATYCNPVYEGYFADPFVLRVGETYYAYGTGAPQHGLPFAGLRSTDLVHWEDLGGVLEPWPERPGLEYWAPEVVADGQQFWMYYSAGVGDVGHHIRVAVADSPAGPFRETGTPVTDPGAFAIDPSPYRASDGTWWLFYACDNLEGERPGTGIVVDRMTSRTTVAGTPRTVVRPTADWQRYQADRPKYGGIHDWHTVEGPFVRERGGRLWCFYSGGNWRSASYGVSVVVADAPEGPWGPASPAEVPTVLATVPERIIGAGHNSVVAGPDGADWIIYHAWDAAGTARRMCIDRLVWSREGPHCDGPTWTPQPAPAGNRRTDRLRPGS